MYEILSNAFIPKVVGRKIRKMKFYMIMINVTIEFFFYIFLVVITDFSQLYFTVHCSLKIYYWIVKGTSK